MLIAIVKTAVMREAAKYVLPAAQWLRTVRREKWISVQVGNDAGQCGGRGFMRPYKHPLYETWRGMKRRCYLPTNHNYPNYGARGIRVCDRWLNSFFAFVEDIGPKPSPTHTIDRKDNDGNYEPGNCRWATKKEQARNYSGNHKVTAGGKTQTIIEWAEEKGLPKTTIINRLLQGYTDAQAVGIDAPPRRRQEDLLPKGWTAMAKRAGLSHQTVMRRVQIHGWTLEKALSTPLQSKPFVSAGN